MNCYDVKYVIQKSALLDRFLIAKYGRIVKGQKDRERVFCGFELSGTNEILGFGCYEEAQMWCDLKGLKLDDSHYDVIKAYDPKPGELRIYSYDSRYVPITFESIKREKSPTVKPKAKEDELIDALVDEDVELIANPIEEEEPIALTDTPSEEDALEDAEFAEFLAMAEKL